MLFIEKRNANLHILPLLRPEQQKLLLVLRLYVTHSSTGSFFSIHANCRDIGHPTIDSDKLKPASIFPLLLMIVSSRLDRRRAGQFLAHIPSENSIEINPRLTVPSP